MFKGILVLFTLGICCGFAGTRDIPEAVRKGYAEKFHDAFTLQCNGLSSRAFWMFNDASQMAINAGEEIQKINVLWDLFRWYRTYGASMVLFTKEPTGDQVIYPNGTRPSRKNFNSRSYDSECGRTPEQAAKIREFMCGVGSTISGVFFIVVGGISTPVGGIGITLAATGFYMMFTSLNNAYSDYERSKLDLKEIEAQMKNACAKDG